MSTCQVVRNSAGNIVKVLNRDKTESKLFKQIASHPLVENPLEIFKNVYTDKVADENASFVNKVDGVIYPSYRQALLNAPENAKIEVGFQISDSPYISPYKVDPNQENPVVQEIINRLSLGGLAQDVHQLTTQQLLDKLKELGVDADVRRQIILHHGSPYYFTRFATDQIGTGEGAQAFGWGLYFTDLESIARDYAKSLAITTFKGEKIDDVAFFEKLLSGLDATNESFYDLDKGTITDLNKFRQYIKDSIDSLEQSIPNINAENQKYQNLADRYTYQNIDLSDLKSDIDIYEHFKKVANDSSDKNDMVNKALPSFKAKADAARKMILEVNKGKKNRNEILKSIVDYDLRRTKSTLNYYKYIDNNFDKFNISRNLYKVTLHKGKTPITSAEYRVMGRLVINRDASKAEGEWGSKKPLMRFDTHEEAVAWLEAEDAKAEYTWLEWDKSVPKTILDKIANGFETLFGENISIGEPTTGEEVYDAIIDVMSQNRSRLEGKYGADAWGRADKLASLFLLDAGIDGIKYPAESISRGATSDTARGFNYVVFDENAITIEETIQFQKSLEKNGIKLVPNGFVYKNEVYLNKDTMTEETPLHEFSHLYNAWLKENRKELYEKGIDLVKAELEKENSDIKDVIDYVRTTQPDLKGEAFYEEILTELTGRRGSELLNSKKKSGIIDWLKEAWKEIVQMLGLTQMSEEQVANLTIKQFAEAIAVDLLRGEELRPSPILSTEQELEQIKAQAIANGTFMKAPNGNSTNLNERQWLQVRSKAFKDWFGDWINDPQNASKVVDENGEPMVVYHGTSKDFNEFSKELIGNRDGGFFGKGFYFTSDKNIAKDAAIFSNQTVGGEVKILPVFLNIKNPLSYEVGENTKLPKDIREAIEAEGIISSVSSTFDLMLKSTMSKIVPEKLTAIYKSFGYNGVIVQLRKNDEIVVFEPNQIKSATDNIGTFSAQSDDIRYQIIGEQNADLTSNRDVQVYITPATIRNFNEETLRLKELTNEYNNVAKEISQGNLENQEKFTTLQHEILDTYQEHIQEKVSKIRGVNVSFNQPYLGSWQGKYEPSLNMTLSISPNADTGAISGLLFDIAENTSQDAFILEERSEIEGRTPLTEFDEAGMMHYPQFRVIFDKQLSVAEKSIIAQSLKNNGVEEFSIDGDYFIVSIIDFKSETNEQREKHYAEKSTTITTLFRGEGEKIGTNRVRDVQKHIRKSKYVGARNEGDEQSQTREYDRSDLFEAQPSNTGHQVTGEQDVQISNQESKAFNEGIEAVAKLADEYKKEFGIDSVRHNKVVKLFPTVSKMIAEAYEQAEAGMTTEEVKEAYKALERETLQQYKFIVDKGLKVSRWTGEGEPYPNSKSMLKDIRENNHLYFLPNSEAFGKEGDEVEGRAGLKLTDVYLEDGYRMTLSEVFRVVHDYFGHGILGNQFGAIGEENATLQHLDLYSFDALPAVIFQTRGQNSWVNFSGVNDEALRKIKEGSKTNNKNLLKEGQKEFRFATPKDNILPKIFNFKTYETARRIHEQEEIRKSETYLDPRGTYEDTYISELLSRLTSRNSGKLNGFSRRSLGVSKRLGGYDVDVIAEYEGNQELERLIKNVCSKRNQRTR